MSSPGENKLDKNKPTIEPKSIKTTTDLQRLRLEKLMKNPEKPVIIPERPKGKQMPTAPDFVRNVMGSSAGAGSGEFHVYRHLRRKEYARQKFIQEKSEQERLDEEYHKKLEENKRRAEEKAAKKRAKRLKKKKNAKLKPKKQKLGNVSDEKESQSDSSDESNDERESSVKSEERDFSKATDINKEQLTDNTVVNEEKQSNSNEANKEALQKQEETVH